MRVEGNNSIQHSSRQQSQELDLSAWKASREAAQQVAEQRERQSASSKRVEGLSREDLEETIEKLNGALEIVRKDLRFELHQPTERLMVHIINLENKEIMKTMPPEEMLDIAARIRTMIGLIIDEKV